MDSYEWYNLNRQFWKYRPAVPIVGDGRAWWRYAFNAVSDDVRRRLSAWSWTHIKAHRWVWLHALVLVLYRDIRGVVVPLQVLQ